MVKVTDIATLVMELHSMPVMAMVMALVVAPFPLQAPLKCEVPRP